MNSWKHLPLHTAVQDFVECYWFLEKNTEDGGVESPVLNPDICAHLILASTEQSYGYESADQSWSGTGSHLILPNSRSLTLDHSSAFIIIGVKFKTGALYAMGLNKEAPDIDAVLDYPDCFSESAPDLNVPSLLAGKDGASIDSQTLCARLDACLPVTLGTTSKQG